MNAISNDNIKLMLCMNDFQTIRSEENVSHTASMLANQATTVTKHTAVARLIAMVTILWEIPIYVKRKINMYQGANECQLSFGSD